MNLCVGKHSRMFQVGSYPTSSDNLDSHWGDSSSCSELVDSIKNLLKFINISSQIPPILFVKTLCPDEDISVSGRLVLLIWTFYRLSEC